MTVKPNMEGQVKPQPAAGLGTSTPEQATNQRSRKGAAPHNIPVSPPDSDEDDSSSTDEEVGSSSEAEDDENVKASPSKPHGGVSLGSAGPSVPVTPAAPENMMVFSESKLREMMRQEMEDLFRKLQSLQSTASMPQSKPVPPVCEERPAQANPSRPRAPFQAYVVDAPETIPPRPNMPTTSSPMERQHSAPSTGRASSFSGVASSLRSPFLPFAHTQSSVSDEKWGQLFDQNGQPTERAKEVFKSVADHIVADFVPQNSIVVTPEKMARFYSQHRLPNEVFPFSTMFSPRSMEYSFFERVADLYEDTGCQYHLVPKDGKSRPTMPGLTPAGFSQWLITNIQAYPEEEAKRLAKIVLDVPLSVTSSVDGKPDRMPRMISRSLLPEQPDTKTRKILDEALKDFIEDSEACLKSPSNSRSSGLNVSIPGSPVSTKELRYPAPYVSLPAVPIPAQRDPNRYNPGRDQYYTDRGSSIPSRRDSHGSGHLKHVDWSSDGNASRSRHGSIPLSPTSERPSFPPPPVARRNRSPQARRHSHTAVNVMQSHPPLSPAIEHAQASASGGLLSPTMAHASSTGGGMPSSPTTLSPEQLATIRDKSPRHDREKEYYNLAQRQQHQQAAYFPARSSRKSLDGAVSVPGQMSRSSGSYREHSHTREGPRDNKSPPRRRRHGTAASEDAKGQGRVESSRHKGK